ncbi:MAG: glycosyltransferase family 2 protein [Bacteroidota bacterium]
MISIIYPYRNRDLLRLKNSLDSLQQQSEINFEVWFVNYGSDKKVSLLAENLVSKYHFARYKFLPAQYQPWNKCRALNSVIKELKSDFCFVADVDMIFHSGFVKKATQLQAKNKTIYFQVGFLRPDDQVKNKNFEDFKDYRKSTSEATGLTMFPVNVLKELRGFDEFYHFWGAEDTDMHVRIKNAGYQVEFYDEKILLMHQWHSSYRSQETKKLTKELQLCGIVQLNHQHLKFAEKNKITRVNPETWGDVPSEEEIQQLKGVPVSIKLLNEKRQIDDFLYGQLPNFRNQIIKVSIEQDEFQQTLKYKLKKAANKKVPQYYSLKEVNDKVLLHLISYYRHLPYVFQVLSEPERIEFSIHYN